MGDPNIIAILVATDSALTIRACQFSHNQERYVAPVSDDTPFSRESTPSSPQDGNPQGAATSSHRLKLSFDKPPKNAKDGYVFGWGPDCDVQLVDRDNLQPGDRKKVKLVSQKHFSIGFDTHRRVVLRDSSIHGTIVNYKGQAEHGSRSHFTWIIFPDFEKIEVKIPAGGISFEIELGQQTEHLREYFTNIDRVFPPSERMGEAGPATPKQLLDTQNQGTSLMDSEAIYVRRKKIGQGGFGRVYKVTDVSTGEDYAGKYVDDSDCAREVAAMTNARHENIIRFVDYVAKPSPMIVIEYMPLGSLYDVHAASPISFIETVDVLVQALRALAFLHSLGFVHRDIKPANILVSSRDPLTIKLADFGLAKHDRGGQTKFQSRVGTAGYDAPEVSLLKPYTNSADIWSLGIVALQLAYGLPDSTSVFIGSEKWFREILDFVKALCGDKLIDFLSSSMLQIQPGERLKASECLEKVLEIRSELNLEEALQPNTSRLVFGRRTEQVPQRQRHQQFAARWRTE